MVVGRFVFVPVVVVTITEMMERPFIWWFESNVESCAHKIFQFEYLDLEYSNIESRRRRRKSRRRWVVAVERRVCLHFNYNCRLMINQPIPLTKPDSHQAAEFKLANSI